MRRAALSAAGQTERPLELILVDDASGDDTLASLHALREELGRDWVTVISLDANAGPAVARNAGWDAARGEYVAFLDADDSWLPQKVERQLAFMRAHPEFGVSGHRAHYGVTGDIRAGEDGYHEIGRMSVLLKNPMVTPSFMARRRLALRFHQGSRHMEDHRLLQEAVLSGTRIARMDDVLAVIHKAAYGEGGLSAELWAMERADLDNYASLRRAGRIGRLAHAVLAAYSLAKFARRALLLSGRRAIRG